MINVVKIGGNIIDNPGALDEFLTEFVAMDGRKILVHGGGKEATRLSTALGIETCMIEGRRVTDSRTLDVVAMVYAGLINKRIVTMLQSKGCDAVGLTGADGNLIPASQRPSIPIDYGFVGDIDAEDISDKFLALLLDNDYVPVICAICHDTKGCLLNCNADSVANAIAVAAARIDEVTLTFMFEKPGVMADINNPQSVIHFINEEIFRQMMAEGTVAAGMIPKIQNALASARLGVKEVRIGKTKVSK